MFFCYFPVEKTRPIKVNQAVQGDAVSKWQTGMDPASRPGFLSFHHVVPPNEE